MSENTAPVPEKMHDWLQERSDLLRQLLDGIDRAGRSEDRTQYVVDMLRQWADAEIEARRVVYLLTAYVLRERVITATEAARQSRITLTAAQSRLASKTAAEVWEEVFGSQS
jgi:hypothetical protein